MRIGFLDDSTMEAMGSYLGRLARRQQVIASNVANIDTPGYKTQDISFHATMDELLSERTPAPRSNSPAHQADVVETRAADTVFASEEPAERPDGNNVNLDREMLKLGETSFTYSSIVQLLRVKLKMVASSINEGRIG